MHPASWGASQAPGEFSRGAIPLLTARSARRRWEVKIYLDNYIYTEKDYWRGYPPSEYPFAFPWEVEYHKKELKKAAKDSKEEGKKAGEKAGKGETARTMRDLGLDIALIAKVAGLSEQEVLAL